ncbi:copper resistance protein CopC [Paracraurococcus ruber]|uniref:CopC domain-containing protein n=1 Tax=Paracraurococcus ruber TaxID=77675 RepID=A0ABS1D3Z7_9PROT|nr:copper resistance protein CopC [Paracraurococcus ruber]MBK1661590.1 hypothetical protein [Paracraurococcus ruber]TDG29155.1 hypothetical protein E2C05_18675 [Paracraurococcus ruber]
MPVRAAVTLGLILAFAPPAAAEPPRMVQSSPVARSAMDGSRQEIWVRFDHPVDHNTSRLLVLQGGSLVRALHPRLDASPDTLYALAGSLAPGEYLLRWEARSRRTGEMAEGSLPFTVR